jgi:hypothetical protein
MQKGAETIPINFLWICQQSVWRINRWKHMSPLDRFLEATDLLTICEGETYFSPLTDRSVTGLTENFPKNFLWSPLTAHFALLLVCANATATTTVMSSGTSVNNGSSFRTYDNWIWLSTASARASHFSAWFLQNLSLIISWWWWDTFPSFVLFRSTDFCHLPNEESVSRKKALLCQDTRPIQGLSKQINWQWLHS